MYTEVCIHIHAYVYTHISHLQKHTGMQHAHHQDKYIAKYVCNMLTCKHGKTEGAEGETREKKFK